MARMKLKGSTILEVLIASIIVGVSFGIGLMIYMNVLTSSRNATQLKAQYLVQEEIEESIAQQNWLKESYSEDEIFIEKTIESYQRYEGIYVLNVKASMEDKLIVEQKKLVLIAE